MPPGLVAARMYTRVPGPEGRFRENMYAYSFQVKWVNSSKAMKSYRLPWYFVRSLSYCMAPK